MHVSLVKAALHSPPTSSFYQSLCSGLSAIDTHLAQNLLHYIQAVWASEVNSDSEAGQLEKAMGRLKLMVQGSSGTLKMIPSSPYLIKALNQLLAKAASEVPRYQGSSFLSAANVTHLTVSLFDSLSQASDSFRGGGVQIKINPLLTSILATCGSLETDGEKGGNRSSCSTSLNDTRNATAALSSSKWSLIDSILSLSSAIDQPSSEMCHQIIIKGLDSLQSCSQSSVINILRSIRMSFSQTLSSGNSGRRLLLLALKGSDDHELTDSKVLAELLWFVLRPITGSMFGEARKKVPLIACYLSLVLMPQAFTLQGLGVNKEDEKETLALIHDSGGPLHWVMTKLIEWSKASPRAMLILSSQFAALIEAAPHTLPFHLPHIKTLLLSSSNHRGEGGDLDLSDNASAVEVEEVKSSLLSDLAPHGSIMAHHIGTHHIGTIMAHHIGTHHIGTIMAHHIGTDVAPRAAIAFGLHNIAMGCKLQAPAPSQSSSSVGLKALVKKTKPRPVIVFGDWNEDEEEQEEEEEKVVESPPAVSAEATSPCGDCKPGYAEVASSGLLLFKDLVNIALNDPILSNDNIKQGSDLHRKKVRLWQGIGVTSAFATLSPSSLEETREVASAMILKSFSPVSPPSIKQYAEGVLAGMLLNHPCLIDELLIPPISSYNLNHSGVGSLILVAGQVSMHIENKAMQERLIPRLILSLAPWLMSHSHSTRSIAQMITWAVLQRFPLESAQSIWKHSAGDLTFLKSILNFMDNNPDLIRLRKGSGEQSILPWSPVDLTHPSRLYTNNISLAGNGSRHEISNTNRDFTSFEGCPQSLIDRIGAYLVMERHRLRDDIWQREREREEGPVIGGSAGSAEGNTADFQRKISPLDVGAQSDSTLSLAQSGLDEMLMKARASAHQLQQALTGEEEGDEEEDGSEVLPSTIGNVMMTTRARQEIIICATLIDKIPNLAGLARTCEVFGASSLVVPNLSVASDPVFSSISVTAERWIQMTQVTEVQLVPYLLRKQKEGYSILGLEQCAGSTMLPDFKFPSRSILVLGREKEGLPAEIIGILDSTIEIPQLGLIRSLNVHVSGAIALYAYTIQHQKKT